MLIPRVILATIWNYLREIQNFKRKLGCIFVEFNFFKNVNIVARIPYSDANNRNYDFLKHLLLNRTKMRPEKCREKLVLYKKDLQPLGAILLLN